MSHNFAAPLNIFEPFQAVFGLGNKLETPGWLAG
jgi:hypothetical protein